MTGRDEHENNTVRIVDEERMTNTPEDILHDIRNVMLKAEHNKNQLKESMKHWRTPQHLHHSRLSNEKRELKEKAYRMIRDILNKDKYLHVKNAVVTDLEIQPNKD